MIEKIEWKTETEMQEELKKRISEFKSGQSKDGYVIKGEGIFTYKNIKYLIRVLRYFNHTDKFKPIDTHRISDCHSVVEYPPETLKLVQLIESINNDYEFLYKDTLHSWNDNQTIEEQLNECHRLAKEDIDSIPQIINDTENKLKQLKEFI